MNVASVPEQLTLKAMKMTEQQERVYSVLCQRSGKKNAIRIRYLAKMVDLPEREVRDIVTALILVFRIPVGSSYNVKKPGYYIISTIEEAEETYNTLKHHAIQILRRAAVVKRITYPELIGQLILETKRETK